MRLLRCSIAYLELIRLNERRRRRAIPISNRFVVLVIFVGATMFKTNRCVPPERHQIGEKKAICRLDFILLARGALATLCSYRVSNQGQRHIQAAPIVSASAPLLRTRTLCLRCKTVIEEEARIAFQRSQLSIM